MKNDDRSDFDKLFDQARFIDHDYDDFGVWDAPIVQRNHSLKETTEPETFLFKPIVFWALYLFIFFIMPIMFLESGNIYGCFLVYGAIFTVWIAKEI